jgi:hypothetical protein
MPQKQPPEITATSLPFVAATGWSTAGFGKVEFARGAFAFELNAANITSEAAMIPNDMNRLHLCIIMLPAGSIGSPNMPCLQLYSLLDAALEIYGSRHSFNSGTRRRFWHPLG